MAKTVVILEEDEVDKIMGWLEDINKETGSAFNRGFPKENGYDKWMIDRLNIINAATHNIMRTLDSEY